MRKKYCVKECVKSPWFKCFLHTWNSRRTITGNENTISSNVEVSWSDTIAFRGRPWEKLTRKEVNLRTILDIYSRRGCWATCETALVLRNARKINSYPEVLFTTGAETQLWIWSSINSDLFSHISQKGWTVFNPNLQLRRKDNTLSTIAKRAPVA